MVHVGVAPDMAGRSARHHPVHLAAEDESVRRSEDAADFQHIGVIRSLHVGFGEEDGRDRGAVIGRQGIVIGLVIGVDAVSLDIRDD